MVGVELRAIYIAPERMGTEERARRSTRGGGGGGDVRLSFESCSFGSRPDRGALLVRTTNRSKNRKPQSSGKMWEPKLNARLSLKCNSVEATLLCLALIGLLAGQTSRCDDQLPVRITIQPNDLVAIEGESAELNCDAEGEPQPTIEWYHNGQLIRASTNSRTTMGGSIQFLDIRPPLTDSALEPGSGDSGVYHCLARNALGEARSRNAILQVACK